MPGSAQPEERFPPVSAGDATAERDRPSSVGTAVGAVDDASNGSRVLAETELDSALQLLVERAQYITGATGTALALPQGEEMVCRASAGASAPAVGARLQVRSGLTGESIARRQLLRCDNAETDPRVNLEACRALGIASIVVLPLLRRNGEVRGLFELFSDHPYAFEERDLVALERMAGLTLTALDLAEQRQDSRRRGAHRETGRTSPERSARQAVRSAFRTTYLAASQTTFPATQSSPSPRSYPPSRPQFRCLLQKRRLQRVPAPGSRFPRPCCAYKNALPADFLYQKGERSASIARKKRAKRRKAIRSSESGIKARSRDIRPSQTRLDGIRSNQVRSNQVRPTQVRSNHVRPRRKQ